MRKEKKYSIVYMSETDGEPCSLYGTSTEIDNLVKRLGLSRYDYAIYSGACLKGWNSPAIWGMKN